MQQEVKHTSVVTTGTPDAIQPSLREWF